MLRTVMHRRMEILGDNHPGALMAMHNLAVVLQSQGDLSMSMELMTKVLSRRRIVLGDRHPETVSALGNLGSVLAEAGRLEEASVAYREAMISRKESLGLTI